ncbi:MAG: type II secretion system F family protein [Rhodoferax sp.]|jgi:type IV pilus assembly protein PilC|nr:type II secretion system F family protein [Rhodoferax sp.]MBP9060006.1 type II secretion system F family protein [Rhodoferax sp.]MBP9685298.1 type II secretion system F family protein [Rhodoferax sp.]
MPLYQYRAASQDGSVTKGRVEALHEIDLEAQLKRIDLSLLSAKVVSSGSTAIKSMPRREVLGILFQLEMLVRAGVPILESLADLRDASDTPAGRNLAGSLFEKIESGSTLGEAVGFFPGVFSDTVVNLIRSGEVTGQLPDVLKEIVRSLKWQDEMATQTKKLLTYPAFVFVIIGGVVFFLMIYLVPQLIGFLKNLGQEIPLQTRLLIGLSGIFVEYWWALLSVPPLVVVSILALSAAFPGVRYKLHQMQLTMPVLGPVLKKMTMARFADTLALMYRTGIPLIDGLTYCEKISTNLVIQNAIRRARERVMTGTSISESFASEQLFPTFVIRMIKVGESTGALDTSLANISYFYSRDIDESISKVQAMIEPALTVVMGLILGWIMLAVLGPIYDTISKMKT